MSEPSGTDVLIVGGGIVGLTAAYFCSRAGLTVRVLEGGELARGGTSWACAGILPPGPAVPVHSPFAQMLAASSKLQPQLSQWLREETGIDDGYWQCGGLEIAFTEKQAHSLRSAAGHYRRSGVTWELVGPEERAELQPGLSDEVQLAYHVPAMSQVRSPRRLQALVAACQARGVELLPRQRAVQFLVDGQRVRGVRCEQDQFEAAVTIVAAGSWSGSLLKLLPYELPVRPIRGQIVLLRTQRPLLLHVIMCGKQYMVPRRDGLVLVGSTEEEVGFDMRPTAGAAAGLLQFAGRVLPPLREATLERAWAGLRPKSADGRPFIGPVPDWEGIIVAAGHFRSGYQLAPATAVGLVELIQGKELTVPIEPFRLDREPKTGRRH